MRLRNTEQEISPVGEKPLLPSYLIGTVHGQLETWSSLFENMLQQDNSYEIYSVTYPLILLLRLQHNIAWTFLRSCGPDKEMEYDNFLPQFQQFVAMADDLATEHEQYGGSSKPTFTPEIGILPVLYLIGVKWRHPMVRQEVLRILRRQPIREAVWDGICTAAVVERVIEIEESEFKDKEMTQSMEHIAVWQRIEALSWVQSAAMVDITYTICMREGVHTVSLTI